MCVCILDTIPKLHIVNPVSSKPKGSNLQDIKRLEGIEQKEKDAREIKKNGRNEEMRKPKRCCLKRLYLLLKVLYYYNYSSLGNSERDDEKKYMKTWPKT